MEAVNFCRHVRTLVCYIDGMVYMYIYMFVHMHTHGSVVSPYLPCMQGIWIRDSLAARQMDTF